MTIRSLFTTLVVAVLAMGAHAEEPTKPQDEQVKIAIATQKQLDDATALINKNMVASDNNIAITRSNVLARQNDRISVETEAADEAIPSGINLTGERDMLSGPKEVRPEDEQYYPGRYYGYRYRYYNPYFRGGYYGWRYPIPYWNLYGNSIYGGYCPYGRYYGGYYYC